MDDELVTFSTAKLAKEKGFNMGCLMVYDESHNTEPARRFDLKNIHFNFKYIHISAPTQTRLQRWLRELHKIHIVIWYNHINKFRVEFDKLECGYEAVNNSLSLNYDTYEKALEAGLLNALKSIK